MFWNNVVLIKFLIQINKRVVYYLAKGSAVNSLMTISRFHSGEGNIFKATSVSVPTPEQFGSSVFPPSCWCVCTGCGRNREIQTRDDWSLSRGRLKLRWCRCLRGTLSGVSSFLPPSGAGSVGRGSKDRKFSPILFPTI